MGNHPLRKESNCLNCGANVPDRFCSQCGQENIEPKLSFVELVSTFFNDLTHYEGKFWQTLKYLLFKPGFLTKMYLLGKRKSYLAPIRLYIFISFLTFLLPSVLVKPDSLRIDNYTPEERAELDSMLNDTNYEIHYSSTLGLIFTTGYKNLTELDSVKLASESGIEPMTLTDYYRHKKAIELRKYSAAQLWDLLIKTLRSNFPKTLFVYMPLFALILGLFHRKRNQPYFDHAIFTLHYFSFVLLSFSIFLLATNILSWISEWTNYESILISLPAILMLLQTYYIVYFYISHHQLYKENLLVSILKSTAIFVLNLMLMFAVFILLLVLTILMLH